jgi:hypothetical protein
MPSSFVSANRWSAGRLRLPPFPSEPVPGIATSENDSV